MTAEQPLVEVEVFLAGLVLHTRGDRDLRRLERARAEHRIFLEHDFELGIGLEEGQHVAERALAVAAVVVEELDHGDVALRVAERHLVRGVEQHLLVLLHPGGLFLLLRRGLALLEFADRLLEHFRVGD